MSQPPRSTFRSVLTWLCVSGILLAAACAQSATPVPEAAAWHHAGQVIVVTTPDWNADHGTMRTFERRSGRWVATADAVPVMVGRAGSAWGLGLQPVQKDGPQKKEGDGRATAGVFHIGDAFGYSATFPTAMSYRGLQVSDYCVDVDGSPLYNTIVDARKVGDAAVKGSTEPMRRDLHANGDTRYKLGFVIEQNPANKAGSGSCIFAHLYRTPTESTAGCTAMSEDVMRRILGWLKPEEHPVFVLMPQRQYNTLAEAWSLPTWDGRP
ncbi:MULTISPECIES: L,D-transpeptidase family protein [Dyella]|uniref:YkuD domain-containing protein n=2 Tax=Dyella TaxID=231454 RepID=A0A4R0YI74_9GAMM|nr:MULTISPECIES: hypothetical protein [Dyella]TBR36830.1 hypothetical protein EYV96_13055 [Dyella terrae]TCI08079.1 hypothetical protein EZM97_25815 [Dyella soli]